jgi:ribosomal protein S18 acetylase RimI-like enzyme
MDNELFIKRITLKANLEKLAGKINAAQWDEGNALLGGGYTADSLEWYLRGEGNFFFVCFIGSDLAGMASAQLLPRAYGKHSTLYVDELDTAVNFRRRGVATALMNEIKLLADETDSYELWLGTEKTNTGAQRLYEKLAPDSVEEFVGYTWNLDD